MRAVVVAALAAASLGVAALAPASQQAAPARRAPLVVSLEFDHAFSDTLPAVRIANRHGIRVTLFALSGRVGTPGYLSVATLGGLQAAGNEIGGHTIDHADLAQLSPAAQRHEICDDRTALHADGLRVTDFAYPYGHLNRVTPRIVRSCGYQSARIAGGLRSQGGCWGPCPAVESIPPADRWQTRSVNSVLETTTVSTIERYVTRGQRVGGWLQIVFHHVCDSCDQYSIDATKLSRFLTWLHARVGRGVAVRTVRQVIGRSYSAAASR